MKKTLAITTFLLLCFGVASFAQIPGEHSSISMNKGKRQVKRFQSGLGQHPSSFLIKARGNDDDGIADYLVSTYQTMENAYLHIYFGKNSDDTMLVITGARLAVDGQSGNPILKHDKAKSGIWATATHEPHTGVPFDCDFDFLDCSREPDCDFSKCTDGVIGQKTAQGYIKTFQESDYNTLCCKGKARVRATESFLVGANDIRAYLKKYPGIEYLQFYIGYTAQETIDNMTILIVGLDKLGHHIWDRNEEGFTYMFNKAIACPECSVTHDKDLDHHRQGKAPVKCAATCSN